MVTHPQTLDLHPTIEKNRPSAVVAAIVDCEFNKQSQESSGMKLVKKRGGGDLAKVKQAVTVGELVRVQMWVSEQTDSRIWRALLRVAAGQETKDESATVSPANGDVDTALKVKEWEVGMFHKEVAATQGIQIRRRPPTGPPQHYDAPFEFRIQSEGKTPCNILEEIIWHKDVEVAQLKERRPLFRLKNALDSALPTKDFVGALRAAHQRTGLPSLIAEVKKASPSRGILREDFDPEGKLHEANRMFSEMKSMNVTPNILTYNTLINGFSQTSNGEMGGRLYEEMVRNGIKVDILTYNALILGLCKVGKRKKAAYLVKDLDKGNLVPNASTFSALITGQCVRNNSENAFQLYKGI
ncbi:hypothetical protein LWI29_029560 [Acer saccharum]|uniref:indole-3-glycerol-phosphate synthase n=1 Tax=Acer saccharum TaxID=4024 RepID=A0AA39VS58_ACESA|nr:hypothetical protein LWI29_029560 [Acer saccharum]